MPIFQTDGVIAKGFIVKRKNDEIFIDDILSIMANKHHKIGGDKPNHKHSEVMTLILGKFCWRKLVTKYRSEKEVLRGFAAMIILRRPETSYPLP